MRTRGGGGNTPTGLDECPLWQSTQVAWRLLFSSTLSAASCGLVVAGNGCPILGAAYSAKTLGGAGDINVPPLWQAMQSCSFCPRSRRAGPWALCGAWQEMHAFCATVG